MYCDTWPSLDDLKSKFESQSTTGSFPFLEEVVLFRAGPTVCQKLLKPCGISARDESLHFAEAECFVRLEESILHLESSWPQAHHPRGCAMSSVLRKETRVWCLGLLSTACDFHPAPNSVTCLGQMPAPPGAWKTHPKIVWPQADKDTASEVARLLFHCQLAQYLTSVEMAVCWLGSLVKNVSTAPFNNLECPLEKAKLMWFFYLKKLRNIAAANSIITLSCQQQFNIFFFCAGGLQHICTMGKLFSLHLKNCTTNSSFIHNKRDLQLR